ncbi:MAG: Asp-tRNA(Asn)/Glu-tRNA(Gln) amidotransferase subunit GatC [Eubacterium sp.]|nr:Asp-tRNA(Asn)/Glu-tRNA(Gln) amidotransferase subunit GatC [Eubacterium sp.]
MEITNELVDKLEALAKISLNSDEKEQVKAQLGELLEYMDILTELDIDGAEDYRRAQKVNNVLRSDEVQPSCDRELILQNAPERSGAFFAVPKAVEEGGK